MLLPGIGLECTFEAGARVKFVRDRTSCSGFYSSDVKAKLLSLVITLPKNMIVDIILIGNRDILALFLLYKKPG